MNRMLLEKLNKGYGDPECYGHPSEKLLKMYSGKVPETLIEEWRERGWCCFAQGVLWTVNPDEYAEVITEFLPDSHESGRTTVVFARSAFGDLLIGRDGRAMDLSVHYGRCVDLAWEVDRFLRRLDRGYVSKALDGRLAMVAIKQFGPLSPDEMFTFEPALALGGAAEMKYVKKVKMFPQLSFLAQLFERITIE